MRSVNSWCGLDEHECAWGEPRCDVHLLISDLSTAEVALDAVRALCDQAEPRHDQYEFAQAVITAIDGSET